MSQNGITIVFAISQRLLRRWNQTGQKFAAEPDIARTFFSHNPDVFWGLLILAYADAGVHLLRKLQVSGLPKLGALLLAVVAFTFKLHFVASESPELLDGTFVLKLVEKWPYSLSLVLHARIVFYGIGVVVLLALLTKMSSRAARSKLCEPQMPREFGLT
jgi:ethanolaminephosphotransferase